MLTEAYVAGLTKDNARMLLDRAKEMGLPVSVVKTVDGGFIVPAVLVQDDGVKPSLTGTGAPESDTGDDTAPDAPEPEPEGDGDDTEAEAPSGVTFDDEPEEKPAPKRRAPARRKKTEAADDDQAAEPAESEE